MLYFYTEFVAELQNQTKAFKSRIIGTKRLNRFMETYG
jgi:hypothetical protein